MSRDSTGITGLEVPQQHKQAPSSSAGRISHSSSSARSRQSPEGREREFPATRVGATPSVGGGTTAAAALLQQLDPLDSDPLGPGGGVCGGVSATGGIMGAGDERYYHPAAAAAAQNNGSLRCSSSSSSATGVSSQMGQSRDFHYSVQEHPHAYRQQARQQQQQARQDAPAYHSPHTSVGSSSSRANRSREYYLDGKGSPYHHGSGSSSRNSSSSSGLRSAGVRSQQHENYLLLREAHRLQQHQAHAAHAAAAAAAAAAHAAQAAQAEYLQHHSGSRQDLLEHDHNALYDLSSAFASPLGPLPPPSQQQQQQQYSFVRTCDGKFVRTNIPIQDFDSFLDSSSNSSSSYYRNAVNHTLRRPSKRQQQAANAAGASAGEAAAFVCCPASSRDELSRPMISSTQSYATLRGRKQRHAGGGGGGIGGIGGAGGGIGDNYGRNQFSAYPMLEDGRSLASFTDDFLSLPPQREKSFGGQLQQQLHPRGHTSSSSSRAMSRSTDRNLDNVGLLSDEELLLGGSVLRRRTSEEEDMLAALQLQQLPREPPDGKEKPEPSKTSMHKMEMQQQQQQQQLSRKNSKSDLLDASASAAAAAASASASRASASSSSAVAAAAASASAATAAAGPSCSQQLQAVSSSASASSECRSEAASMCGDNTSVLSGINNFGSQLSSSISKKRDSLTGLIIKDSVCYMDSAQQQQQSQQQQQLLQMSDNEVDSGIGSSLLSSKEWKSSVPGSPHVISSSSVAQPSSTTPFPMASPKAAGGMGGMGGPGGGLRASLAGGGTAGRGDGELAPNRVSFGNASSGYATQQQQQQLQQQQQATSSAAATAVAWHQTVRRYVMGGTARFFGVDAETEHASKVAWADRRKRLAIKKFGGIKDSEFPIDGSAYSSQYIDSGSRLRFDHHLTSELEGDKMVLKISKPPRNKDSLPSLTAQGFAWMLNSLMTRKVPVHQIVSDHEQSRSYQPSTTGIAAYYQAEQAGGLAVCPPPLPRANSSHLLMHGESPAEEVFFTKPSCDGDEIHGGKRIAYSSDHYRPSNWQRPLPSSAGGGGGGDHDHLQQQQQHLPRMSSDVGASRIWNRLLDAAFDNSDRRKHGMGAVGRVLSRRRASRRAPESARKRKLGGNAADHRPFFTYWMTVTQVVVMAVSMAAYGVGPVGVDLYKKAGMVLVTNLELEPVGHLEPANFWIGPSATSLIHLGAKYAPCMRWDEALDRDIREERLKERDTACCIRKDRAGCVQSPKAECSKVGEADHAATATGAGAHGHGGHGGHGGATPRSNWWRPSEWYSKYPNENRRSSGPVCGLDPAYCEAPASVAPYIWPDDITKWPICRRKTDVENMDTATGHAAEHMICEIIGHPCCIGIRGQCKITTKEYCMFVGGSFHEEAALCSQVSCLDDVCGLLPFRNRDVPDQFYRTWTPLFLHAGVIHLAISVSLQYWLMRDLEKLAGAGRIAVIYMGSGMVGNLASAIFVPYRAEVGPSGAHFGLLACCMVEVIHQWPQLRYPEMAILKLVGVTAVLFLAGLLPWIDNYAHLFGFIFGFLLSYALLPFVTLGGEYERGKKVVLVWVCLVSVAMLFLGLLLLFYVTPIHDCEICKYFNCIPITKDFCADQNIDLRATELI